MADKTLKYELVGSNYTTFKGNIVIQKHKKGGKTVERHKTSLEVKSYEPLKFGGCGNSTTTCIWWAAPDQNVFYVNIWIKTKNNKNK